MKPHERIKWIATLRCRSTVKVVLFAFCRWTDEDGICWPSIASIAHASGLSHRQVQRVLRILEKGKVLSEIVPSEHKSATYRLMMTGDSMSSLMGLHVTQTVHRTPKQTKTAKTKQTKPRIPKGAFLRTKPPFTMKMPCGNRHAPGIGCVQCYKLREAK